MEVIKNVRFPGRDLLVLINRSKGQKTKPLFPIRSNELQILLKTISILIRVVSIHQSYWSEINLCSELIMYIVTRVINYSRYVIYKDNDPFSHILYKTIFITTTTIISAPFVMPQRYFFLNVYYLFLGVKAKCCLLCVRWWYKWGGLKQNAQVSFSIDPMIIYSHSKEIPLQVTLVMPFFPLSQHTVLTKGHSRKLTVKKDKDIFMLCFW